MIYDKKSKDISVDKVGGKAHNLALLADVDVTVPEWFVLSCDVFYDFLGEDIEKYTSLLNDFSEESRLGILSLIRTREFSAKTKEMILEKVRSVFSEDDLLAVRSSATDEDGDKYSFAGMMESYLEVKPNEEIFGFIKKCYLSCFSERITKYRLENGIMNGAVGIAVIIQKMIVPNFAGVIFTSNPRTNDPDECLICAVRGVGEKLVSGDKNSTDYTVDCMGNITAVSENSEADIGEDIIRALYDAAMKVEESFKPRCARDIEFCIKDGKIYILQSRAITNYSFADKNKFRTILDNSNIIESYSGVTTPLTYTFAREVYSKIYKQTLKSFYVSDESIKSIESDLDNMLAFYQNKIYYRLNSWYKMTSLYPGYEKNKKYMENMMGVKVALRENHMQAKTRTLRIYASLLMKFASMKKHSRRFIEKFNAVTKPYYGNSFENFDNRSLLDVYNTLETEILNDFITPIANDMGAMVFYGMLTDKLKKKNIPNFEGLLGSVISKQGDVESAQQSEKLLDIAKKIRSDSTAREIFSKDTDEICGMIDSDLHVFSDIREYIYKYGARTMDELKLETVTLFEDPSFLIDTLKSYIRKEPVMPSVTQSSKENAETELLGYFGIHERWLVKRLIKITKYFIRNRESLRLRRTYIYSIVRSIYLQVGRNLTKDGTIKDHRDIFYLEKDEITNVILGKGKPAEELQRDIAVRKKEYSDNKDLPIYERMYFYGDITPENALPVYSKQERTDSGVICGVAGGGKVVEGIVKLVRDPSEATDLTGYILMAKRTDPGWTVLFPMADAIIIERGSVLSHSAVVAREMGLTLVAGIRGLTDKVRDGMRVRVDGINGTVEILDNEK